MEKLKIGKREGSKFGTERAKELLARLGNPDKKLKIIHVAGSNGKGSVCAMLTDILIACGKRTGTLTSPAVFCYGEQFCIDGLPAAEEVFSRHMSEAISLASDMPDKPSRFEYEVCAAIKMFADEGCEYCVLECGLGGLYDATNAVGAKCAAIITSISPEHTDVLGDSIMDICRHKGGIINNCPSIVPANLPAEAADYFAARSSIIAGRDIKILSRSPQGTTFLYNGREYRIKLFGIEQAYNAALAIECAHILGIPDGAVQRGLEMAELRGRVQTVSEGGRTYILDGAHNPAAFAPLIERLEFEKGPKTLIFACLSDKRVGECAAILGPHFEQILLVAAPGPRAMDIAAEREAFSAFANVRLCEDIPSALEQAANDTIVACGSFTILKEVANWIEQRQ